MDRELTTSFALLTLVATTVTLAEDPSKEYEAEMQTGGFRGLALCEDSPIYYGRRATSSKLPHGNMRKFYDLAGLPKEGSWRLREPYNGFAYTPQSIKKAVDHYPFGVDWGIWRLHLRFE